LPKIQSKHIKLSALAVLVSITIGIYLFGIVGGIISIPIAGCVNVLIEDHFARAKKKRSEEDKTPEKLVEKVEIKL
jgi:predicted PurR-regulated permease PerM